MIPHRKLRPSYHYHTNSKHEYDPICSSCTDALADKKPIKKLMNGNPVLFCSEECLNYYSSHPALEVTATMIKYHPKKAHFDHHYSSFY